MEQIEEWREIPDRPGYFISDQGRIIGRRGRVIRGSIDKDGYNILCVDTRTTNVKTYKVHRLVYEMFVGAIPGNRIINHKNGVKNDNRVDNLEIVTHSENTLHAARVLGAQFGKHGKNRRGSDCPQAKLTEEQVREIRERFAQGVSGMQLSREYPVSQFSIQQIIHRRTWAHLT